MPEELNSIIKEVTPKAQEKIKYFIADRAKEENKPEHDYRLRIFVEGGGCAGFQYGLNIDPVKNDGDTIQKFGDLEIIIDPMSAMYLKDSIVDYTDGLQGSGFKVINPNASGGCGCGHSFSV